MGNESEVYMAIAGDDAELEYDPDNGLVYVNGRPVAVSGNPVGE